MEVGLRFIQDEHSRAVKFSLFQQYLNDGEHLGAGSHVAELYLGPILKIVIAFLREFKGAGNNTVDLLSDRFQIRVQDRLLENIGCRRHSESPFQLLIVGLDTGRGHNHFRHIMGK